MRMERRERLRKFSFSKRFWKKKGGGGTAEEKSSASYVTASEIIRGLQSI